MRTFTSHAGPGSGAQRMHAHVDVHAITLWCLVMLCSCGVLCYVAGVMEQASCWRENGRLLLDAVRACGACQTDCRSLGRSVDRSAALAAVRTPLSQCRACSIVRLSRCAGCCPSALDTALSATHSSELESMQRCQHHFSLHQLPSASTAARHTSHCSSQRESLRA